MGNSWELPPGFRVSRARESAGHLPKMFGMKFLSSIVIKNLHASVNDQEIVRGLNLEIEQGRGARHHGAERLRQEHAGQGARRHPDYEVTAGEVLMDGENILETRARRARAQGAFPRVSIPDGNPRREQREFPPRRRCRRACRRARNSRPPIITPRLYEKMDLLGDATANSRRAR